MHYSIPKKIKISVNEMFRSTIEHPSEWHPATSRMLVRRMFPIEWLKYYAIWMSDRTRSYIKSEDINTRHILRSIELALDGYGIEWSMVPSISRYQKSMGEYSYIHKVRFLPPGIRILMRFSENMWRERKIYAKKNGNS